MQRDATDEHRPAPKGVNPNVPNMARMWDYQLGGKDNFAADRRAAEAVNAALTEAGAPTGREAARDNRALIHRMVRYLASEAGIRQFLDLGSGLPSMGNVHEVAHAAAPEARVVYVDYDPVVVVHGRAILAGGDNVTVLQGDLREPQQVLREVEEQQLLDLDQPVAVLLIAMLHCLYDEEDPWSIAAQFRDAIPPGSYLALAHLTHETHPDGAAALARTVKEMGATTPLVPRSRQAVERFFGDFELVEPGLVYSHEWRPDSVLVSAARWMLAAIGRKQ